MKLDSEVKPEFLQQTYYQTTPEQKLPLLIQLLKKERDLALVFCNRKHYASKLARHLAQNAIHARSLHGDLSQSQRERVTEEFRKRKITVLVATDVAARGLHIEGISHVYNYEIPRDVDSYTHRVGRTARAGEKGEAISFVATPDEQKFFKQILFSHQGRIKLQRFDPGSLPVPTAPTQERRRKNVPEKRNYVSSGKSNYRRGNRRQHEPKQAQSPRPETGSSSGSGQSPWKKKWKKFLTGG